LTAVFAKALAKDPAQRYPSLEALALALQDCRRDVEESRSFFYTGRSATAERLVQFLVRRYQSNGPYSARD
jgi:hypothetical protein